MLQKSQKELERQREMTDHQNEIFKSKLHALNVELGAREESLQQLNSSKQQCENLLKKEQILKRELENLKNNLQLVSEDNR